MFVVPVNIRKEVEGVVLNLIKIVSACLSSTVDATGGNRWNRGGEQGQQVHRQNRETEESVSQLCGCKIAHDCHECQSRFSFKIQRKKVNNQTYILNRRRRFWCGADAELPRGKRSATEVDVLERSLGSLPLYVAADDARRPKTEAWWGRHASGSKVLNQGLIVARIRL